MRVAGGTGRGRRLRVPAGDRVRPTSDKVKQALFNILGPKVSGAAFLDLFAGSGAIGIEALSRGAERVVFIDDARRSLKAIRHNLKQSGFCQRGQVIAAKAESYVTKTRDRFGIVFLDPPYTMDIKPLLQLIDGADLLEPDGVIVAEHIKKQPSPERAGSLMLAREAVYGDTVLAFYTMPGDTQGPDARKQEGSE